MEDPFSEEICCPGGDGVEEGSRMVGGICVCLGEGVRGGGVVKKS